MSKNHDSQAKRFRALRDLLMEASEEELRDALAGEFDSLADRCQVAAKRALAAQSDDFDQVRDLHRGLGALIQLLRRRAKLSPEELAKRARISSLELRSIESDPSFDPSPRTIYQLEQFFDLQPRSLVVLSGAVHVNENVRDEIVRFAANAKSVTTLSVGEKQLLNEFVRFLRDHTD